MHHIVDRYTVCVETMSDPSDPSRGDWVACFVSTPDGRHSNSLEVLEDFGRFDDGPRIAPHTLARIRDVAESEGWEG